MERTKEKEQMVEEKTETEKKNAATEEIKEEPEATEEPEKPKKSRMDGHPAAGVSFNHQQPAEVRHGA